MELNMIRIVGRSEGVGRPMLFGTTRDFMTHFGLRSLADLPKPRELEELLAEGERKAMAVGQRNGFRRDDELELALEICTYGGAAIIGDEGYGLEIGCRADCVLVEGETLAEAVVTRAPRKLVLKGGDVTARDGKCVVEAP